MSFKRAVKHESHLRLALAGIAGSGKTYTALTLATALAHGAPIALIDTEHGSASKYADLFTFDVMELSNFHPQRYINAIHEAEDAGYSVLIIDSLSHAWNGTGGALELVETTAKRVAADRKKKDPNTFNAWGEVTPLQNKLIDTMLVTRLHLIVTMRAKTEYVVEKDKDGKFVPCKVGMAPVQRADVEYEFDIFAEMNADNTMIIQKSRMLALSGQVIENPDHRLATTIAEWLAGEPAPVAPTPTVITTLDEAVRDRLNALFPRAKKLSLCQSGEQFLDYIRALFSTPDLALADVTLDHLATVEEDLFNHEAETEVPS
jgi:hypothetical protein